jgi:hypothetical protein
VSSVDSKTELADSCIPTPCVACRLPLPIRSSPLAEVGQYWHCVKCGTRHHGILLENAPPDCAANVRLADDEDAIPQKPAATNKSIQFAASSAGACAAQGEATQVQPDRDPIVCNHQTRTSQALDKAIINGSNLTAASEGPPLLSAVKRHGARPYDMERAAQFVEECDQSLSQLESLIVSLEKGETCDLEVPESITRDGLVKAMEDLDLFVRLGINPPAGGYPDRNSFHVAMLAASVGANMGWDEKTLVELGVGCLLHDIGMLRVPNQLYHVNRSLDDGEFAGIARHPLHTLDLLVDNMGSVPLTSRMVAYQIHERCNGTGYPRRRHSALIHEIAKVAAVADVYVALVSSRPHRSAMMPYHAVMHLIYGAKNGVFDSDAVRALLKTVSLFPIGSFLSLQDGRKARVIRANPADYGRPIIETWLPNELDASPTIIDLAATPEVAVKGPLPSLAA